jgi:hypothetical protein
LPPLPTRASARPRALPRIAAPHGRPALFVDGAPFLMLGAQANNSSNHASVLPQVWQTMEQLSANTLEMPVAWAQPSHARGSSISPLSMRCWPRRASTACAWCCCGSARSRGGPGYTPVWVRADLARFPRKLVRRVACRGFHRLRKAPWLPITGLCRIDAPPARQDPDHRVTSSGENELSRLDRARP